MASDAGGDLGGSVRFRLYNNETCDTTSPNELLYDSNVNFPSGITVSGSGDLPAVGHREQREINHDVRARAVLAGGIHQRQPGAPGRDERVQRENSSVSIDNG